VSGTTILIVDDNADNREVYSILLEHAGYAVVKASDGWSGVQQARACHPDLILMDISMPVMDGFQATEILKADPATHDIPVLAVTAHDGPEHRLRARHLGMSGYLTKPLPPGRVLQEVDRCLANGRDASEGDRPPRAGADTSTSTRPTGPL
jgi:two-component system, cell cycle response regulator DivK